MYRLYLMFLLSGAAGLAYQVVWSRLLHDIFGVTIYAVTTVLATFLGGLALGGVVLGSLADRWENRLRMYGWLEVAIGVTAASGAWVLGALEPAHIWAANRFPSDSAALVAVRVALAALVILPPTFFMGGTLPVMTRVFVDRVARLGRELSTLYALNTMGAVLGTVATGFGLIRLMGLSKTLWLAVMVNLAVGAAAIWLAGRQLDVFRAPARRLPRDKKRRDRQPKARSAEAAEPRNHELSVGVPRPISLLWVMGLSGFASLGLEVFWTRLLVLVVGTTTYAFVTMLASFLVGITLGSLLCRLFVDRLVAPRRFFGWVQVGIALSVLATLPLAGYMSRGTLHRWVEDLELEWGSMIVSRFAVSFAMMLVPTTLIGMTFPLAGKLWVRAVGSLGTDLGRLYGANTAGNILGAVISGFLLLPAVGLQKGITALVVLNLLCAAWGLLPAARARGTIAAAWRAGPVIAGIGFCVALLLAWQPPAFVVQDELPTDRTLYYKEGLVATVKVVERGDDPELRWMAVDGIRIGQSRGGVDEKQQALAHFPFLLMPQQPPRRVMSIGLGTGVLIGEVARHSSVQQAECVEISPSVIEASSYFDSFNHNALHAPSVRILCDDGVNYLRRRQGAYDAIISDAKSRSAHAGNALFFSADYYQLCRDHLAPGGVMVQWVPLTVPANEWRTILRTFLSVFDDSYVWFGPPQNAFLVGTDGPLVLDAAHIQRVLNLPATENLRRYGWDDAGGFVSLLMADQESLAQWLGESGAVNSLEHPILEFYLPSDYAVPMPQRVASNLRAILNASHRPIANVHLVNHDPQHLAADQQAVDRLLEALILLNGREDSDVPKAMSLLDQAVRQAPHHGVLARTAARELFRLAETMEARGQVREAIDLLSLAAQVRPNNPQVNLKLAIIFQAMGDFERAGERYRSVLRVRPNDLKAHTNLGIIMVTIGRRDEALQHFQEAVRVQPAAAEPHANLAQLLKTLGRRSEALQHFREALRWDSNHRPALVGAAWILATHPDQTVRQPQVALQYARRARRLAEAQDLKMLDTLAAAYAAAGQYERATQTAEEAVQLAASKPKWRRHIETIRKRLELYRQSQAFVEAE